MLRIVNELSDRMLSLFVPRATASAADCGYPKDRIKCYRGFERICRCWTNSNCACEPINSCHATTHAC
jgi:hypothetical protein